LLAALTASLSLLLAADDSPRCLVVIAVGSLSSPAIRRPFRYYYPSPLQASPWREGTRQHFIHPDGPPPAACYRGYCGDRVAAQCSQCLRLARSGIDAGTPAPPGPFQTDSCPHSGGKLTYGTAPISTGPTRVRSSSPTTCHLFCCLLPHAQGSLHTPHKLAATVRSRLALLASAPLTATSRAPAAARHPYPFPIGQGSRQVALRPPTCPGSGP
jgi:hypothetical protein